MTNLTNAEKTYSYHFLKWDAPTRRYKLTYTETRFDPYERACVLEKGVEYGGACSVSNTTANPQFCYVYDGWQNPSFLVLLPARSKCRNVSGNPRDVGTFEVVDL